MKYIRHSLSTLMLVFLVSLSVAGCRKTETANPQLATVAPTNAPPAKAALRKITIAQAGDFFLYAPLYVAKDAGFFERNGLDVSIVSTGGDEKTWAAVVSENASFGVADPTFVAVSDQRGLPGKVVASIVNGVPFWGVTFDRTIVPFKSARELRGHTVATFPSPSTAYTLQAKMFKDAGLKPSIREGAFGTILTMLKSSQADIGLELEPNVSTATKDGARVVYSLKDQYGDFAITGLTATPELLEKDAELPTKVVCSIQQALSYIHDSPAAALNLLAKRFPEVGRDVAASALQRVSKEGIIPANAAVTPEAWRKAIELRLSAGELKSAKSFGTYVDNRFAEAAASTCK